MDELILVRLDSKYCDFLRQFDNKVPYNYGKKELRPIVGVLFLVNDCKYFAPLSSPKEKHKKLRNKIDFLKLDNGKLGAINFNNMIPVNDNNVIKLDLEKIKKSDILYSNLLKNQIFWLNRNKDKVYKQSKLLYDKYVNDTLDIKVKLRCCNFILLEEKCREYSFYN